MKYETTCGMPTEGETYAKLMEHLRESQECAAMLAHLHRANDRTVTANGWLAVSEHLRKMQFTITNIAVGKMS